MGKTRPECSQNAYTSAFLSHWIQILANSSPKSDIFKKKKKKKRPCFFAFYGRSGEGNITIFFFGLIIIIIFTVIIITIIIVIIIIVTNLPLLSGISIFFPPRKFDSRMH